MFTVLQIEPYQKPRFLQRLFYRPPAPKAERIAVRGGMFFYRAVLFADKHGEADLSVLPDLVGSSAQRILFCGEDTRELAPPLRRFVPVLYPSLLFLNTAYDFLKAMPTPPNMRALGVVDADARLQKLLFPFVRLAKTVKVYTNMPEKYDVLCAEILSEWGLSVIVSEQIDALADCDVILAPFAAAAGGQVGILQCGRRAGQCYAGDSLLLPSEAEARRPSGVAPVQFASALYELCNASELKDLRYADLKPIKNGAIY